jgi:hypothetical protein
MKNFLSTLVLILSFSTLAVVAVPSPTHAADDYCNGDTFLGFHAWYNGICDGDKIKSPTGTDELKSHIGTIILNIVGDIFVLASYVAVGFLIYGGYLYILARGTPDGIVKAKKTIMNAIIGLVIAVLSAAIANTIVGVINKSA